MGNDSGNKMIAVIATAIGFFILVGLTASLCMLGDGISESYNDAIFSEALGLPEDTVIMHISHEGIDQIDNCDQRRIIIVHGHNDFDDRTDRMEDGERKMEEAETKYESKENAKEKEFVLEEELVPNASFYYEKWLCGYLEKGGETTHHYDHSAGMEPNRWVIISRNTAFADGIQPCKTNVIVLEGIRFTIANDTSGESLGPGNVFFMDNFTHKGNWVPMYTNITCDV